MKKEELLEKLKNLSRSKILKGIENNTFYTSGISIVSIK